MRMRTLMSSALATAVVATPIVAITAPADAAPLRAWNRLAHCESGGRWHINTGNGYFGGLQIGRSTWQAYGGRHFARNAHHATKAEQIRIGERIKRGQGWRAWPACSSKVGLR